MLRRFACTGAAAACLLALTFSAAAQAAPAPDAAPNRGGTPLSIPSGLASPPPCHGPGPLKPIFAAAALHFGLRWQLLAAVTQVESDFGCDLGPSSAGASGWTQFMPGTWAAYGVDADGDGRADPASAPDAIFAAARYLRASGAPADERRALLAYNHAGWYAGKVLRAARSFGPQTAQQILGAAGLQGQASSLTLQASVLRARARAAGAAARVIASRLGQARRDLAAARQAAAGARAAFTAAARRLDAATARYVALTQGVAGTGGAAPDADRSSLEYLSDSARPQDAALVYASARAIMDSETDVLARLRQDAQAAGAAQAAAAAAAADARRLADGLSGQLAAQQEAARQQAAAAAAAEKAVSDAAILAARAAAMGTGPISLLNAAALPPGLRAVAYARAELALGVREIPDGSNDSPDIARYRRAVIGSDVGPWCAYFASWVARQAGFPIGQGGQGMGYVPDIPGWARAAGRWIPASRHDLVAAGDLIVFSGHVGVVEAVRGAAGFTTIEGNYSNRLSRVQRGLGEPVGFVRMGAGASGA